MLRVLFSIFALVALLVQASADPVLTDDLATCRNPQSDKAQRLAACEKLIDAGTLTPKDLAIARGVREHRRAALRELDDVVRGILQRCQLSAVRQYDQVIELAGPRQSLLTTHGTNLLK